MFVLFRFVSFCCFVSFCLFLSFCFLLFQACLVLFRYVSNSFLQAFAFSRFVSFSNCFVLSCFVLLSGFCLVLFPSFCFVSFPFRFVFKSLVLFCFNFDHPFRFVWFYFFVRCGASNLPQPEIEDRQDRNE